MTVTDNIPAAAIIPAAGSGSRMGLQEPKQYCLLAGEPLLVHTVRPFFQSRFIKTVVVVVPAAWMEQTREMFRHYLDTVDNLLVVEGGKRRQDSVRLGIRELPEDTEIVLVHDGARPLITTELIDRCYQHCLEYGAVIAAVPVKDTVKQCGQDNRITRTIPRDDLWQAQTPQAARLSLLKKCYADYGDLNVTDEASLLELGSVPVHVVEGSEKNIKVTRPEDLVIAEKLMESEKKEKRIGHGYDAHRFADGRKLVLGGVEIPYKYGLAGHSDADVLCHAVCDAILGATGQGDIGSHFPDSDDRYRGISSLILLESVIQLAELKGYRIVNIDVTVVCQKPKLAPYLATMRQNLAGCCRVEDERINIKATTTEKMGFVGRLEGIGCHSVVLLDGFSNS